MAPDQACMMLMSNLRRGFDVSMIGREQERAVLRRALDRALAEQPTLALLSGEAGIGKSTVAEDLMAYAHSAGWDGVRGACSPKQAGDVPFGPVVELLRQGFRTQPARASGLTTGTRRELGRLLPEFDHGDEAPQLPGAWQLARLLSAVSGVIEDWGRKQPVVLLVEDVHWADEATLGWLAHLTRNARASAVMVLVTYRDDEGEPSRCASWVAEHRHLSGAAAVRLPPMSDFEVAELAEEALGQRPAPSVLGDLAVRSGGIPFHVQQLLASGGWDRGGDWVPGRVPSELAQLLLGRVRASGAAAAELLRVACVVGRAADDGLLAAAGPSPDQRTRTLVRRLLSVGLLRRDAAGLLLPQHALLAESVLGDLLPGELRAVHSRVAEAMAAESTSAAAEVAAHFHAAGDATRAFPWYARALSAAVAQRAFRECIEVAEQLVSLWGEVGDADARREAGSSPAGLLLGAAVRADALADEPETRRLASRGLELVNPAEEAVVAALLEVRLASQDIDADNPELANAAIDRALVITAPLGPSRELAEVLLTCAHVRAARGQAGEQRALLDRALRASIAAGAGAHAAHARALLARLAVVTGTEFEPEDLVQVGNQALSHADLERVSLTLCVVTDAMLLAGHLEEAASCAAAGRTKLLAAGYGSFRIQVISLNGAEALIGLEDWEEASGLLAELGDNPADTPAWHLRMVEAYLDASRGGGEAATRRLRENGRLSAGSAPQSWRGVGTLLAEAELWSGRPDAAAAVADEALARLLGTDDEALCAPLVSLRARATADLALRGEQVDPVPDRGPAMLETLSTAAAEELTLAAERLRGARTSDPDAWSVAEREWTRLRHPWRATYARWRLAEALVATGAPPARVEQPLLQVHATAERLGARPLLAAVRQLARRTGVGLPRAPAVATRLVTARELEVLALLAEGCTNKQVATRLFMSTSTVRVHVTHLLAKLGAGSRAEAVATAYRLGLL